MYMCIRMLVANRFFTPCLHIWMCGIQRWTKTLIHEKSFSLHVTLIILERGSFKQPGSRLAVGLEEMIMKTELDDSSP